MTHLSLDSLPEIAPPGSAPDMDIHAYLKHLRGLAPLVRSRVGPLIALRRRHVDLLVSDATRQLETETKLMQGISSGPIFDFIDNVMLMANGDVHQRRRAPVARTFAFKLMDAMRPKAAALAEELIASHLDSGEIDFITEIAAQIPARLIANILGIPAGDLPIFMQWIEDSAAALGFIDLERQARIEASLIAFNAYVEDLLAQRRQSPRGDFLSEYVAAVTEAGNLSQAEIRTQIVGLILAGSDTTRGSLCVILAHLLAHPAQWAAFCADPDGLKKAVVEEGMRFEPIASMIPRVVLRDLDIDGYLVPAGTIVAISILSCQRDPEIYGDPDRFDIFRTDHPRWNLSFGAGAHRCLGEALARAELEETLALIARLAPRTRIVGPMPSLAPAAIRQIGPMRVDFGGR